MSPTTSPEPIDYIERWRRTVVARREQHDAACATEGRTTRDYWARRAESFRRFVRQAGEQDDPFLECLLRHLKPEDEVLDVGAGTGRHTVPLARYARRVIALDPSPAMLRFLHEDVAEQRLTNVEVIEGGWPEAAAQTPIVDAAISAHVLYPIEEVLSFLTALDAHARRLCFLNLMVWQPWFDRLGLWEAVHGTVRLPQPTAIDALNLLHQLGCYASLEVAWVEIPRSYADMEEAMEGFAETVAVGEDEERRARLREALAARLETGDDGRLVLSAGRYPVATLWWEAGALSAAQVTG